jgi:RNA polymerase sigma-70 factor, ECF subfamily
MSALHGADHVSTEELFRQHSGFVVRLLSRLGVAPDHVEDALQEVFLVVHRHGGYRPGIAKPTSYLANIAIRAAAQHRRRQVIARARSSDAPVDRIANDTKGPAHAFQTQQELERFQLALDRLPEELRTTLLLVEVEGESCISVAAGLGCAVGTIYWRLHQARKKLQSTLAALNASRRKPQTQTQPSHAQPDERAVPMKSYSFFAGFRSSETARMLRRASEQQPATPPVDELLARHLELVRSGAELPAWASNWIPHTASWVSVLGVGPIVMGVAAVGALAAALMMLAPSGAAPSPHPRGQTRPVARTAQPTPVESAKGQQAQASGTELAPQHQTVVARPPRRLSTKGGTRVAPAPTADSTVAKGALAQTAAVELDPAGGGPDTPVGSATDTDGPEPAAQAEPVVAPDPPPKERPREERPAVRYDPTVAEMREVAEAERLLASDPARALEMTRQMRARFEAGYFAEERVYVEVMALHRLGRSGELREKAAAFLRSYPDGPYTARVRNALASASARN